MSARLGRFLAVAFASSWLVGLAPFRRRRRHPARHAQRQRRLGRALLQGGSDLLSGLTGLAGAVVLGAVTLALWRWRRQA